MKAAGQDVINLGVGEPDFQTPEHIKEAAIKAIRDGFTRYTPSEGILELREAVCRKLREDNGLDYGPDQVVISNGGKHSLYNVMQTLFGPGDQVIIPSPYWVTYPALVCLSGAEAKIVPTRAEDGYLLAPEALREACGPRTKGLIVNSPSNPTGMVYDRKKLLALAETALELGLWIISDDIYEKLVYDGASFCNPVMALPELKERAVICHGVSKTYSMTGWRIGYTAGPKPVAQAMAKLQSQMTSNPCSIAQKAALAALDGPQDCVREMRGTFAKRRLMILGLLESIPGFSCPKPQGAFYVFPDISGLLGRSFSGIGLSGSDDLASLLLEKCKVATVPGSGFGQNQALRLSYASSEEEIARGLKRINDFLS
jgi:aspartate aminotransferase